MRGVAAGGAAALVAAFAALVLAAPAAATMVTSRSVVCGDPGYQDEPGYAHPWVVYSDKRAGDWNIYAFNVDARTEKVLCGASGDQTHPDIADG